MVIVKAGHIFILICVVFLFNGLAEAAGEYAFIARGAVTEVVSRGNVSDYKLKQANGETVLLKSPGLILEKGQDVAFFVRLGAKEGGLTTYLPINFPRDSRPYLFTDGLSYIKVASDNFMVFDKQGRSVGKLYESINPFSEGLASVYIKGAWGFIDTDGNLAIEPGFESFGDYYFKNGFAAVSTVKAQRGYIDKKGNMIVYPKEGEWMPLSPFSEGLALIKIISINQKHGDIHVIDENGVIQNQIPSVKDRNLFGPCMPFSNGLAPLRKNDRWGFINRTGEFVIEPEYRKVSSFSEGLAAVETLDYKCGYIDTNGNWVVNASYDEAYPFSDGLAPVQSERNWGYVNKNGELAIKMIYSKAGYFSGGVAPVALYIKEINKEKWGIIDKKGNWVLEPKYDGAYGKKTGLHSSDIPEFSDDLLLVHEFIGGFIEGRNNSALRYAWIDRSGKEIQILIIPNRR